MGDVERPIFERRQRPGDPSYPAEAVVLDLRRDQPPKHVRREKPPAAPTRRRFGADEDEQPVAEPIGPGEEPGR